MKEKEEASHCLTFQNRKGDSTNSSLEGLTSFSGMIPKRTVKLWYVSIQNVRCCYLQASEGWQGTYHYIKIITWYLFCRKWKCIFPRPLPKSVTVYTWATQRNVNSKERELIDDIIGWT